MSKIILTVKDLEIALDPSGVEIDHEVNFELVEGEVLGLVGESASGKTTAATSLLNFQRRGARISGGSITIDEKDVLSLGAGQLRQLRGGVISYVPQDPGSALNPALRIGLQLREILEVHDFGKSDDERRARIEEMMAEVLLPSTKEFLKRYPHQLSGGQQQRVALAMAFACRPKIIVLDEPTTGLDVTTQAHVLDTIRDLAKAHHAAAVYVTHDLAVVAELADRVAVMYAGRLVEIGPAADAVRRRQPPLHTAPAARDPGAQRASVRSRASPASRRAPGAGRRAAPSSRAAPTPWRVRGRDAPQEVVGEFHRVRCWRSEEVRNQAPVLTGDDGAALASGGEEGLVTVRGVTAWYGNKEILHDIDITLRAHECLALVGESGSGKTTLARCIAGLHPFKVQGEISFQGKELPRLARSRSRGLRHSIQYVFQNPYSSLNPRKTIAQILSQPLSIFFDYTRDQQEARLAEVLDLVSLDDTLLSRYPDQLSGGERQRVAIARALAAEPTVLVCDEVTSCAGRVRAGVDRRTARRPAAARSASACCS